jgi:hypothetical protein
MSRNGKKEKNARGEGRRRSKYEWINGIALEERGRECHVASKTGVVRKCHLLEYQWHSKGNLYWNYYYPSLKHSKLDEFWDHSYHYHQSTTNGSFQCISRGDEE